MVWPNAMVQSEILLRNFENNKIFPNLQKAGIKHDTPYVHDTFALIDQPINPLQIPTWLILWVLVQELLVKKKMMRKYLFDLEITLQLYQFNSWAPPGANTGNPPPEIERIVLEK